MQIYNQEIHRFYTSPNTIKVITSSRMKVTDHVARIGNMRNTYKMIIQHLKRNLSVHGLIIFKLILKKFGVNWIHLAHDSDH